MFFFSAGQRRICSTLSASRLQFLTLFVLDNYYKSQNYFWDVVKPSVIECVLSSISYIKNLLQFSDSLFHKWTTNVNCGAWQNNFISVPLNIAHIMILPTYAHINSYFKKIFPLARWRQTVTGNVKQRFLSGMTAHIRDGWVSRKPQVCTFEPGVLLKFQAILKTEMTWWLFFNLIQ